jgi:hypothetical protein
MFQIPPGFTNLYPQQKPFFYYPPKQFVYVPVNTIYHPKPPMVQNQAPFSLFNNPDYFGFYSNNIIITAPKVIIEKVNEEPKKDIPVPRLIFTDLNINSNDYIPGREWSPSSSNTSTPRSNNSNNSNNSTPKTSPRKINKIILRKK